MSNYTEVELNEFYRRREEFLNGEHKGYSVKESHNYIRRFVKKIQESQKQAKEGRVIIVSSKNLWE